MHEIAIMVMLVSVVFSVANHNTNVTCRKSLNTLPQNEDIRWVLKFFRARNMVTCFSIKECRKEDKRRVRV